jgi:hypothetical protein
MSKHTTNHSFQHRISPHPFLLYTLAAFMAFYLRAQVFFQHMHQNSLSFGFRLISKTGRVRNFLMLPCAWGWLISARGRGLQNDTVLLLLLRGLAVFAARARGALGWLLQAPGRCKKSEKKRRRMQPQRKIIP